jgi:hypothetical protein
MGARVDEAIEDVLATGGLEDPDDLDRQAAALDTAATQAVMTPPALFLEAAQKRARAVVLRKRAAAVEAVRLASDEVARCEAIYDATEEPERRQAGRAFHALQLLQDAHRALSRAGDDEAEPAALAGLHGRLRDAEAVEAHEAGKVAQAQADREAAKATLDAALAQRWKARAALQQVEATLANPGAADLGISAYAQALLFAWPFRLVTAAPGSMSKNEADACRWLAGVFADKAGSIPAGAARRVREMDREELERAVADARRTLGGTIALPASQIGRD